MTLLLVGQDLLEHVEGVVEEIQCAAQRRVELLHRLADAAFLTKTPKFPMLLLEERLLGIQHQVVNGQHDDSFTGNERP